MIHGVKDSPGHRDDTPDQGRTAEEEDGRHSRVERDESVQSIMSR